MYGCLIGFGMEVDGLFCDEMKNVIFRWRREMGMEYEESLKIEVCIFLFFKMCIDLKQKEIFGGCIDFKMLFLLLSLIISVYYQLDVLDVE